jgi:hypothetical protein
MCVLLVQCFGCLLKIYMINCQISVKPFMKVEKNSTHVYKMLQAYTELNSVEQTL